MPADEIHTPYWVFEWGQSGSIAFHGVLLLLPHSSQLVTLGGGGGEDDAGADAFYQTTILQKVDCCARALGIAGIVSCPTRFTQTKQSQKLHGHLHCQQPVFTACANSQCSQHMLTTSVRSLSSWHAPQPVSTAHVYSTCPQHACTHKLGTKPLSIHGSSTLHKGSRGLSYSVWGRCGVQTAGWREGRRLGIKERANTMEIMAPWG